jgi:hypothetical protein
MKPLLSCLSKFILLLLIPILILYPEAEVLASINHVPQHTIDVQNDAYEPSFTYDDILDLLDELECDEPEEEYSLEELRDINNFIALLARQGVLPHETFEREAIENDIEELLNESEALFDYQCASFYEDDYSINLAIFSGKRDIFLCKSWASKQWHQTKKFVKKHKKAIIIGAAVVVAATVVVCAVVAVSSAAAVAAVGAAGAAAAFEKTPSKQTGQGPPQDPIETVAISNFEVIQQVPEIKETIEECTLSMKESIKEEAIPFNEQSRSFAEQARDLGALLAHQALDAVAMGPHYLVKVRDEIVEIFYNTGSGNSHLNPHLCPESLEENYLELVAVGHEKIDQIFCTEMTEIAAAINNDDKILKISLPPPLTGGALSQVAVNGNRIPKTLVSNVRGWKVGQDITNRTKFGTVPTWSSVRRRYWKNRAEWAKVNKNSYGEENIKRMQKGLAPQKFSPKTREVVSMELHHIPPQRDGGLFDFIEVWPEEHAQLDPSRYLRK